MGQKHMVSVVMITYNHEKFIAEAIKGVFMQKCDFDIEFIIANDKSTDQTNLKILDCLSKASIPENIKIEYSNHKQNKGVSKNFIWSLKKSKGKYIALCEGDDYWTDTLKLQKQVDHMESHPECVLTYHDWRNKTIDGKLDPIKGSTMLLTLMFRNVIDKFPREFYQAPNGDSFLRTMLKLKGTFNFIDGISPAVRRMHEGGVMSMVPMSIKLDRQAKTWLAIYNAFKDSKLGNELFYKKNIFIYTKMLFDWGLGEGSLIKLIIYPIQVNHLKLYVLFFKTILGIHIRGTNN